MALWAQSVVAQVEPGPQKYTSGPGSAGLVTLGEHDSGGSLLSPVEITVVNLDRLGLSGGLDLGISLQPPDFCQDRVV